MIVGFLLATLTQVGAAEIGQSDYVEFTVHDLAKTKTFFNAIFGSTFAAYGPNYSGAFRNHGLVVGVRTAQFDETLMDGNEVAVNR
jgi:predicted enzyme related to lactoylglutathione lyase